MKKKQKDKLIEVKEPLNDELITSFTQQQNKSDMNDILKELFNEDKIELITDLSLTEIKIITKIKMIADIKKIKVYDKGVEAFMRLKLSQKRASRKELIEAVKGFYQTMMHKQGHNRNILL